MIKRYLVAIIIFIILLILTILNEPKKEKKEFIVNNVFNSAMPRIETLGIIKNGITITHYGPDCKGCSGKTASGYNVKNTIYYRDKQYGKLRIVAAPKNIKLFSVLQIKYGNTTIYAIVLDRGGAIKGNKLDLLVESEKKSSKLGVIKNAKVEILRSGKK